MFEYEILFFFIVFVRVLFFRIREKFLDSTYLVVENQSYSQFQARFLSLRCHSEVFWVYRCIGGKRSLNLCCVGTLIVPHCWKVVFNSDHFPIFQMIILNNHWPLSLFKVRLQNMLFRQVLYFPNVSLGSLRWKPDSPGLTESEFFWQLFIIEIIFLQKYSNHSCAKISMESFNVAIEKSSKISFYFASCFSNLMVWKLWDSL